MIDASLEEGLINEKTDLSFFLTLEPELLECIIFQNYPLLIICKIMILILFVI